MKKSIFTVLYGAALVASQALSAAGADDESAGLTAGEDGRLEIVVVTGVRMNNDLVLETSQVVQLGADNSELLRLFPGANRNANGPMSRISQYRGLFGAQNNVTIDGIGYTADCPNWMDTPLSSIPQSLTESVTLYRGLGTVIEVPEGLGGGIEITARRGDFADTEEWSGYGQAEAGYGFNASSLSGSVFAGVHNLRNRLDFAASTDRADNYHFNGGVVAASEYERQQYRFGYGRRFDDAELAIGVVANRTGPSGTPALPMDMRYVDSDQYSFELDLPAGSGRLALRASTLSVEHMMDNFTLRPPPLNQMGKPNYRQSGPRGDTDRAALAWTMERQDLRLVFGADAEWVSHTARITDPTRSSFYVDNFNDVKRDRAGLFGSVTRAVGAWDFDAGLRYNRVRMDAGEVGGNLAIMPGTPMYIQQIRLNELADAFNASDRSINDDQWSGTFKASRDLVDKLRLNLGLGRKVRSPSYQERYLWLPLESTAGLADGRTYIGEIGLKPEKSLEFTAGIDWTPDAFKLTPELFYRRVDRFIQGVPSTNETANRFAMMMSGAPPLQYANIDAEFYGADLAYEWRMAEAWLLRGNLSYVRGKRRDNSDNLYRIAPLSSFIEILYSTERWYVSLQNAAAARQDRVAGYNNEQVTPGWGILHVRASLRLNDRFSISAGVENLADKAYQDHLGGYNRVRESDVPVGERLYSTGRNVYLKLDANW